MASAPPPRPKAGPAAALRWLAARTLGVVRSIPVLHRPVHALAERVARHPAGARLIRSVLEPHALDPAAYARWIARCDTLTPADLAAGMQSDAGPRPRDLHLCRLAWLPSWSMGRRPGLPSPLPGPRRRGGPPD